MAEDKGEREAIACVAERSETAASARMGTVFVWSVPWSLGLKNTDLSHLVSAMRDRETEDFQFRHEKRGPGTVGGRDGFRCSVVIGVGLAYDINGPLTAGDVDELVGGIEEEVVGVAGDGEAGDQTAIGVTVNQKAGRVTAAGEQPVVGLVQKQREVGFGFFEGPGGGDFAFFAVYDGDVVGLGH